MENTDNNDKEQNNNKNPPTFTSYTCSECNKDFRKKSNLKRHVESIHLKLNNKPKNIYICQHCGEHYSTLFNLKRHLKRCNVLNNIPIVSIPCCLCRGRGREFARHKILDHYKNDHNIDIVKRRLSFETFSEFEKWKSDVEATTIARYAKCETMRFKGGTKYYYRCHRRGYYQAKGNNLRALKRKGSNKINGYCPAKIVATIPNSGTMYVDFVETHVGHTMDIDRLSLRKADRDMLALKIQDKYTFDEILAEVRDQPHLSGLTKKDLYNIVRDYQLKEKAGCVERESLQEYTVPEIDLEQIKKELSKKFNTYLDLASSIEHLQVIENALDSIGGIEEFEVQEESEQTEEQVNEEFQYETIQIMM